MGLGGNPAVKVGRWMSILKRRLCAKSLIMDWTVELTSVTLYLIGTHGSIRRVPHYFLRGGSQSCDKRRYLPLGSRRS